MKGIKKEKTHLVFDTNVLKSEPFYSRAEYRSLQILVENGHLEVYLPKLVEREYIEQLKEDFLQNINSIERNATRFSSSLSISVSNIDDLKSVINKIQKDGIRNIENSFQKKFYDELCANTLEIELNHALNVFENYFEGIEAFSKKKERKDIPDAFIVEAVKSLKYQHENIVFLVSDKQLISACKSLKIKTCGSLKEFLRNEQIQELLERNSEKYFIAFITTGDGFKNIYRCFQLSDLVDEISGRTFIDSVLPSDNHDATIASVDDYHLLKINTKDFTYLGENKLSMPFSCKAEVSLEYFVFKPDYYSSNIYGSESDWNEHYFLVEAPAVICLKGSLVVDFSGLDFRDASIDYEDAAECLQIKINYIEQIDLVSLGSKPDPIECKCNSCDVVIEYDCNDLHWECIGTTDRNMGEQHHYSAYDELYCDCGNFMSIQFDNWEYPVGILNTSDSKTIGCTINKECILCLHSK